MKLGIITRPETENLTYAKNLGLEFVEFDIDAPNDFMPKHLIQGAEKNGEALLARVDEFKSAIAETGVAVGAVGRWGSRVIDADGKIIESEFEQVKALMDFAKQTGAGAYLISVGYVPELTYYKNITAAINYLNKAVEYAGDLPVCIVNCNTGNHYIRKPEEWRIVLPEVPGLKIKYDPSHSFVHGGATGSYIEEAFEFGDRIGYVHIKGTIQGAKFSHGGMSKLFGLMHESPAVAQVVRSQFEENFRYYDNPPAGLDSIDWPTFMAILYKSGYDGMLSIEPHSRTWRGELGERGVKYTIDYMRKLMI